MFRQLCALKLFPQCAEAIELFCRYKCRRNLGQIDAFFLGQLKWVDHAQAIDQHIGKLGRDDFAPQTVACDLSLEFAAHLRREGGKKRFAQNGVIRQIACFNRILQNEFGGRKQHCQFGAGEAFAFCCAPHKRLIIAQAFGRPIELAACFQSGHEMQLRRHAARSVQLRHRKRQSLQPIVSENQLSDVFGHLFQQCIAPRS